MGKILDYSPAIEAYISGMSLTEASKIHRVDRHTLSKKLVAQGIEIRPNYTYWTRALNHSAFDVLTDEVAYWIGMLMADGCIYTKTVVTPEVRLELAHRDRTLLEQFKLFLSAEHPIRTRTMKLKSGRIGYYDLFRYSSQQIADRLAFYGVVPQKTNLTQVHHLEHNRHFWRCIVDVVGSMTWTAKYPALHLVGSKKLMQQFCEHIAQAIDIHTIARKYKYRKVWTVCVYGRKACTVTQHLYSQHTISLDRKQVRAKVFAAFYTEHY